MNEVVLVSFELKKWQDGQQVTKVLMAGKCSSDSETRGPVVLYSGTSTVVWGMTEVPPVSVNVLLLL